MALDIITICLDSLNLLLYVSIFFILYHIRKKLDGKAKTSFTFFITSVVFLIIRSIQLMFNASNIINSIPYVISIISLMAAATFFLAVLYFYFAIRKSNREKKIGSFGGKSPYKNIVPASP